MTNDTVGSDAVGGEHLLNSVQMANFAADGMLVFDNLIPDEVNREAMREIDEGSIPTGYLTQGQPLGGVWENSKGFGALFRLPQVRGIIQSLVGANPLYDHHAFHKVGPHHEEGQTWHADAIIDTRLEAFDIQLFYYPHDTPREMGGTMFLPGSHLRRVHETNIGRYQNFVGQKAVVCKAGTLAVGHHGIWHCAQPNYTNTLRYMFKLRVNPTAPQVRLWNTGDEKSASADVEKALFRDHKWYGNENRIEFAQRIKFWRALSAQPDFDVMYWLTRIENMPQRVSLAA